MIKDNIPFEQRRTLALEEAERRCREVWDKNPEIEKLDRELSDTGIKIFKTAMLPDGEREAELERLGRETLAMQEKRRILLQKLALPENYTKPEFVCDKCSDTGFVGYRMCDCLKTWRQGQRARMSGLGKYLDRQTFEKFSLDYYPADCRDNMKTILNICLDFAESFDGVSGENLLFVGGTGLGKTHLSGAIAHKVLEKGFSVAYDSAQSILASFERDRFSQSEKKASDKYFDADLLIIDDLGTEIKGPSSMSYFYTLVNTRLVSSKSTVISTNLDFSSLNRQYEDRFISRLLGEYQVCLFKGEDIRKLKK